MVCEVFDVEHEGAGARAMLQSPIIVSTIYRKGPTSRAE